MNDPTLDRILDADQQRVYLAWLRANGFTRTPEPHPYQAKRALRDKLDERLEDALWGLRGFAPNDPAARPVRRRVARLERAIDELNAELSELESAVTGWRHYCRWPECGNPLTVEQARTASMCPRCLALYHGAPGASEPPNIDPEEF